MMEQSNVKGTVPALKGVGETISHPSSSGRDTASGGTISATTMETVAESRLAPMPSDTGLLQQATTSKATLSLMQSGPISTKPQARGGQRKATANAFSTAAAAAAAAAAASSAPETDSMDNAEPVYVTEPTYHDVLLGRGSGVYNHAGNINFLAFLEQFRGRYLNSSKTDKTKLSREIVYLWSQLEPPGRFLALHQGSGRLKRKRGEPPDVWFVVDDARAKERTAQCLRERMHRHRVAPGDTVDTGDFDLDHADEAKQRPVGGEEHAVQSKRRRSEARRQTSHRFEHPVAPNSKAQIDQRASQAHLAETQGLPESDAYESLRQQLLAQNLFRQRLAAQLGVSEQFSGISQGPLHPYAGATSIDTISDLRTLLQARQPASLTTEQAIALLLEEEENERAQRAALEAQIRDRSQYQHQEAALLASIQQQAMEHELYRRLQDDANRLAQRRAWMSQLAQTPSLNEDLDARSLPDAFRRRQQELLAFRSLQESVLQGRQQPDLSDRR